MNNNELNVSRPPRKKFWIRFSLIAIVMAALYVIAFAYTDLNIRRPDATFFSILYRLFIGSWLDTAVWAEVPRYLDLMLLTVCIAFAGTLMGAVLAIPVSFLASKNMVGPFSFIGKSILSFIRAFPELLFAVIFVFTVGIGPFAGVLAIGINSVGMLGKLYSEVIESIDKSVLESLRASGANKLQVIWYGVIPQVVPECLSYVIYRFEIDVRSSTVLGIVGAGGIGTLIILMANNRSWEHLGMMLIIIILSVTIIDYLSSYIRKRIV
jgi:phosphonate transport system permease protein